VNVKAVLAAAASLAALASPALAGQPADLVIWDGPIYTGVDKAPKAEAVAVRGDRIVYVGSKTGAAKLVGTKTKVADLKGASLYPGFTDSHAHLLGIGERELTLNLEGSASAAEVAARLKAYLPKAAAGETVIGRGWIETHWPEKRFLNRQDLDAVVADRPALMERADGHALTANSAALKAAGITRDTPVPAGGQILKDAQGEPTGVLVDNAMELVAGLEPKLSPARRLEAFKAGIAVENRYGWTGVHNMSASLQDVNDLEAMDKAGVETLRVYNAVDREYAPALFASGPRATPDGRVVTRAIKAYADGALGSRGAALFDKYSDFDGKGTLITEPAVLEKLYAEAYAHGFQVCTHAIGDRGNALVLDLYEKTFAAAPPKVSPRWRDEHSQIIRPVDIPRLAKLGVIASMQPSHAIGDLHFAPARLGMERLKGAYAWKSLLKSGAVVVGGSDAPVERGDPLIEFYAAVARKDLKGFTGPGWHPEERLTRAEALKLFTSSAAYARFAESDLGRIKTGLRADLTGFNVDLMHAPEAEIPKGHAVLTVVDGQVVYRAPELSLKAP
jgi:predicted amidohydrolase YtcJ